jgi:hypothetical protein
MHTLRAGPVALVLAASIWAQLCLSPVAARSPLDPWSLAFCLLPLVALVASVLEAKRSTDRASLLALAGFPFLLGVSAVVSGRDHVPRFDAPSRVLAAATVLVALGAAARWRQEVSAVVPTTISHDDRAVALPAPRLRRAAFGALTFVAMTVSVFAPALLGAREPSTLAERLAGESLLRGRGALVTATGTLLALAIVLQGGSALLRAGAARARTPLRALTYVFWALCALIMRRWLDHAR